MKVVHLVAGDLNGGAARGAYWLHQGLRAIGVDSKILTNSRDTLQDTDVTTINTTFLNRVNNSIRARLDHLPVACYPNRKTELFSTGTEGYNFTHHPLYKWADIIHLHWINLGFVKIKDIASIEKPIVWTLRDMWPMTGGCHIAMECLKYTTGCGACPQLNSRVTNDLSRKIVTKKKALYPGHMHIVGISNWITECARSSEVLRTFQASTIPNNVKCDDFYPVNKSEARRSLDLPEKQKIVLAGAQKGNHTWKGFEYFMKAMDHLKDANLLVLIFGEIKPAILEPLGLNYRILGPVNDLGRLRNVYSSADVFVAPSVMESFGKTLAEAMACGTPVVCFDATGPKDIVDHLVNGYRAKPLEAADLATGIQWVLNHHDYTGLSKNARKKVVDQFDNLSIARKYHELYTSLIQ